MFLRFTKKFSRPVRGFVIALFMLFAPALIATTVESAQRSKPKATPTPKKKTTPTPDKKIQAKTKPTPKPSSSSKSKTNSKNASQTASKNKTADKRNEKNTASKNNRKTSERDKNSKTANTRNSKQTLTANSKNPSKTSKNERNSKTADKNTNRAAADKNKSKPATTSKNTKPTVTKNSTSRTPKKTPDSNKTVKQVDEPIESKTSVEFPRIIVTTFSVPVRSQASVSAPAVERVRLGTVLRVTEKNPAWYKVQYSAGGRTAAGWISANSVNDLNAAGKTEIYRQIVERNYKPQMDFAAAAEFYEFLTAARGELDASDKSAEIELKRLLALRSALRTIPADRSGASPYKDFLKAQENEIVYNEPAGQWLVTSNQFWDLHTKYKDSTVSDTIAWEAANNPLPGECEGYVNCYLFDMRMRFGEYLNLHPNGSRAAEALKNMTDYLSPIAADIKQKTVYNGPTDVTDRAEFNNLIAELRTIVARLSFVEKEKTLQQLRQIAEAYR